MNKYFLKNTKQPVFICLLTALSFFITTTSVIANDSDTVFRDTGKAFLPDVFNENQGNIVEAKLRQEAILKFPLFQLPAGKQELEEYRTRIKNSIIKKTGALLKQKLPLLLKETGSIRMKGYTIKNITFQTRPGIIATANLYVPDGSGKFPGVVVMMGHSSNGRFYDKYQSVGITLALNGYVSLSIDPWGAGERTTVDGEFEDHGDDNNLGAALLDVGETLMGIEITDNIRAVDLLSSLPYVDADNIGATGASGGGNQTMWLAAMDERVKAAVPVVSVGTFESYVMGSPCICEVLVDALTFTEEAVVLSMVAPRAIKMCNHSKDANQAFNPREMLRSFQNAKPVFEMMQAGSNIAYDTFNLTHGYWPEDRRAMLGWFNLHLKGLGTGAPVQEVPFETLPGERLRTYPIGKRDPEVVSTEEFCKRKGTVLRTAFLNAKSYKVQLKRDELRNILRANDKSTLKKSHEYVAVDGWQRFALETSDDKLIPVLVHPPVNSTEFVILSNPGGKQSISVDLVENLIKSGSGIAVVDLSGTGETSSAALYSNDSVGRLRTLSKSYLFLGKTVLGEWVKELEVVNKFIKSNFKSSKVSINGDKEAGLAALYLAALEGNVEKITLSNTPVSYLFDKRTSIENFSTGVHIPGFLTWGDVSLAAALSGKDVTFIDPVTMSGEKITGDSLKAFNSEFEKIRKLTNQPGETFFK